MITINVDEGYAYDYLAILEVKYVKKLKNSEENFVMCFRHMSNQLGEDFHNKIFHSLEYRALFEANKRTFDAVEKARYGDITAKEVDDLNMKRYYCKIALQNKFFPTTKVLESKT